MNRTSAITFVFVSAILSTSGLAWSQETMPEPATEETRAAEAGEAVSDAWITTKVKADLLATGDVPGSAIQVETDNGVVTLRGTVGTQAEADRARSVARLIKGVKQVDSQISVSTPTP